MGNSIGKALTPKQAAFVERYLVHRNGAQAAREAGFSAKTADKIASELLDKPHVRAAVDAGVARLSEEAGIDAKRVLRELARIALTDLRQAFDDKGRLLPVNELPEDIARAISGVEVEQIFEGAGRDRYHSGDLMKVKFWDKPRALELLGKHLGMFSERLDVNHSGTVTVSITRTVRKA